MEHLPSRFTSYSSPPSTLIQDRLLKFSLLRSDDPEISDGVSRLFPKVPFSVPLTSISRVAQSSVSGLPFDAANSGSEFVEISSNFGIPDNSSKISINSGPEEAKEAASRLGVPFGVAARFSEIDSGRGLGGGEGGEGRGVGFDLGFGFQKEIKEGNWERVEDAHGTTSSSSFSFSSSSSSSSSSSAATIATKLAELKALRASSSETQTKYWDSRHLRDVLLQFLPNCSSSDSSSSSSDSSSSSLEASWKPIVAALRPLKPRLYSISSSPLENPLRVQATVAEVVYESLGLSREGVCSTLLSSRLKQGDQIRIYIHKNPDFRLPAEQGDRPIIMVGPGTGLAPFRSFIVHRQKLAEKKLNSTIHSSDDSVTDDSVTDSSSSSSSSSSSNCQPSAENTVLYFGCRRRDQDYLYGDVLEGWAADGKIQLYTAFSREKNQPKVYVQQRLKESAEAVWKLISRKGAHFYVCGDGARMAVDVESTLLADVISVGLQADAAKEEGGKEEETEALKAAKEAMAAAGGDVAKAARAVLAGLSSKGRYQRDVWC